MAVENGRLLGKWKVDGSTIRLYQRNSGVAAVANKGNRETIFDENQVQFGICKNLPHQELLNLINEKKNDCIFVYPYPSESPNVAWVFPTNKMSGILVARAKELTKENKEPSREAFKKLKTALKISEKLMPNADVSELKKAIKLYENQLLFHEWFRSSEKCLLNSGERSKFQNLLKKVEEDVLGMIDDAIANAEYSTAITLFKALLAEQRENFHEAVSNYVALSKGETNKFYCLENAYKLLGKNESEIISAMDLIFSKVLRQLRSIFRSKSKKNCVIFFEKNNLLIDEWVRERFATDFDKIGVRPVVHPFHHCENNRRKSQLLIERSDFVLLICTKEIATKCQCEGLPIEMDQLTKDGKMLIPIFLQNAPENKKSYPQYERYLNTEITLTHAVMRVDQYKYYYDSIRFFSELHGQPKDTIEKLQMIFLQETTEAFLGNVDLQELSSWKKVEGDVQKVAHMTMDHRNIFLDNHKQSKKNQAEIEMLRGLCRDYDRIAIVGEPGVGKTLLAELFLNDVKEKFDFTHLIQGAKAEYIKVGLLNLADDLGLLVTGKVEERLQLLKNCLSEGEKKFLIVVDGVNTREAFELIREWLPKKVLITTSQPNFAKDFYYHSMQLHSLRRGEALSYFEEITNDTEIDQVRMVVEMLSYHPLALVYAREYIVRSQKPIKFYLPTLRDEIRKLEKTGENPKENALLASSLILLKFLLKESGPIEKEAIKLISFLDGAPFPMELLETWISIYHPKQDAHLIQNLLEDLIKASVLKRSSKNSYRVVAACRVTSSVVMSQEEMVAKRVEGKKAFVEMIVGKEEKVEIMKGIGRYLPHIEKLFAPLDEKFEKDKNMADFLTHFAEFYSCKGETRKAKKLAKSLLIHVKEHLPEEETKTADAHSFLGQIYHNLSNYGKARENHSKALEIRERKFGRESLMVANTLVNLGVVCNGEGNYREACQYEREALKIRTRLLDENDSAIGDSLSNLGCMLESLGEYEEAIEKINAAREIFVQQLGEKHVKVAVALNNMGLTLIELGRYKEAIIELEKSLKIREENRSSPAEIAQSHNNLGSAFYELGQLREALEHQRLAQIYATKIYGKEHRYVAAILSDMGKILRDYGDLNQAFQNQTKALEICHKIFGESHPMIAFHLRELGITLRELGRYNEAFEFHKKTLMMMRNLLGEKHSDLALTYNELGNTNRELGNYEEALWLQKKGLELNRETLGDEHPDEAVILESIGMSLVSLSRYDEAIECLNLALKVRVATLGEDHPEIAFIYNSLGIVYGEKKQYSLAIENQRKALEIRQKLFGQEHPHTILSMSDLGVAYGEAGKHQKAKEYHERSLMLAKKYLGEEHPSVGRYTGRLAFTLSMLSEGRKASIFFQNAIRILKATLGNAHPELALCLNNAGTNLIELGENERAKKLFEDALGIRRKTLGEKHPALAQSMNNLGACLSRLGQYEEALVYLLEALKMRQWQEKFYASDTVSTLENVLICLKFLMKSKQFEESLNCIFQVLEKKKGELGDEDIRVGSILEELVDLLYEMGRLDDVARASHLLYEICPEPSSGEESDEFILVDLEEADEESSLGEILEIPAHLPAFGAAGEDPISRLASGEFDFEYEAPSASPPHTPPIIASW